MARTIDCQSFIYGKKPLSVSLFDIYDYYKVHTYFYFFIRLSSLMIVCCFLCILSGCQSLAPFTQTNHLPKSQTLTATSQALANDLQNDTSLIKRISATTNPNPMTLSGYYPVVDSSDAFAVRSVLASMTKHSIDIQYYIWHNDASGQLMLKDLYDAANRGVKIRLLLDDLNTNSTLDQQLLAFAAHPNISVRLMNPKVIRKLTAANFLIALPRYQHRMHNKSMTFDHQLSIIGGRNIGDEYLRSDADIDDEFVDLDVLLAGKVVNQIDDSFEQYWNSPLAYDIQSLVKPAHNPKRNKLDEPFLQTLTAISPVNPDTTLTHSSQLYHIENGAVIDKALHDKKLKFRWKPITFVVDDVSKLTKLNPNTSRLIDQVREKIGTPKKKFTIISSYFVPTDLGVLQLSKLAQDGIKINVFTNSYESTDVPIVHSGYSVARKALLKAGVNIYEFKSSADPDFRRKKHSLYHNKLNASLHTKAFAVDDDLAFIGSYNVDPRSANINTELGVIIRDSELAKSLHRSVDESVLNVSYHVTLQPNNQLLWQTHDDKTNKILLSTKKEPKLSIIKNMWVKIFSVLPIKWLL